jgi:ABC-type multidrug transport system fused ATPase/permease subunit
VVWADKIIVLDRGQVVEVGSHAALIERQGLYWQLYGRETADVGKPRAEAAQALQMP